MAQLESRVEALEARIETRDVSDDLVKALRAECFDKQLAVWDDPARSKGILGPRRIGKTEFNPRFLLGEAAKKKALTRYWGISRLRAKHLIWDHLRAVDQRLGIGARFNDTELEVRLPGGGMVRLHGADKEKETQKKRGDKVAADVVDESQLFGSYMKTLCEDVIEPGLMDLQGCQVLEGTPGVVCAGYWFDVSGGNDFARRWESTKVRGYSLHRWMPWENPYFKNAREEVYALKAKRGWDDKHPTWLREYCGIWVNDTGALFYKWDEHRNSYKPGALIPWGPGWQHVVGWDLGKVDAMALVYWAFHPKSRDLIEAFSWKESEITSDLVVAEARAIEARLGLDVVGRVADTGGLGALIVEEVAQRTGMHFEAAKKTDKRAHVEMFNGELLAGRIKTAYGSVYSEEIAQLPKQSDWVPEEHDGQAPPEDPRFANHCCDAGLYGWRRAAHWMFEPEAEKPPAPNTPAWFAKQVEEMENQAEEEVRQAKMERAEDEEANEWL
jgi:hypothetical protein